MYLAEFTFPGTTELANHLLIQASSEQLAEAFAQKYAAHWEMELFSLTLLSEIELGFCRQQSLMAIAAA
jgi:hypothetical protein